MEKKVLSRNFSLPFRNFNFAEGLTEIQTKVKNGGKRTGLVSFSNSLCVRKGDFEVERRGCKNVRSQGMLRRMSAGKFGVFSDKGEFGFKFVTSKPIHKKTRKVVIERDCTRKTLCAYIPQVLINTKI